MINWGISSIKIFKKEPQNIFDLAESENGPWKILNPAKFDCKIFNISTSAPANIVNMLTNLRLSVNHWKNSGLVFSFVIIRNANSVFDAIGSVKNIKLFSVMKRQKISSYLL